MILYHGSDVIVEKPNIKYSSVNLDFGKSFYLTSSEKQAKRWAIRKAALKNKKTGYVSIFNLEEIKKNKYVILDFKDDLNKWIDFVCECRNGGKIYQTYDIIKGKVADDKVFRVVDMYKRKIWDKERALKEIKVYDNYDQVDFVSQKAIDELLEFKRSYEGLL